MPEEDKRLVASVLEMWEEIGVITFGVNASEQLLGIFDLAKDRLDKGRDVLGMIYGGDQAPLPLRDIMQPFLSGEVSREETERRLDDCTQKLNKWLPILLAC